jgi:DNA primase
LLKKYYRAAGRAGIGGVLSGRQNIVFLTPLITKNTIEQIRSRLDIVEVIGGFIKLKKRGVNYLGNCPFHNEKTPSFTVSPSKEIYKCFGCGKSGNTISFLMEHEKYSYTEALKWLAAKYNVQVEETEVTPEQREQIQTADSLYIINNFAQQYFSNLLFENDEGQAVGLEYFKDRGFKEETIRKFQLGYCLEDRQAFARAALANQFNSELLLKTGLVTQRDEQLVDNYRGRVVFPIQNQSGKIIGFGARILKKNDRAPKYINTPENEIYNKSRVLYGLYFARQTIDRQNECLLVEGYTDVISLHQAGIENVVASSGTSLTIEQLRLIKKHTRNLTILYDGDAAGIKAALRGLDLALEEGLAVQVVLVPDGHDPDSYVNEVGAAAFKEYIQKNKKDVVLFQLQVSLKEAGGDSQKKAALVNQVAETISKINKAEDFTRQQDYIRQCADALKIDEKGLQTLVNKFIREKVTKEEQRREAAEQPVTETATETDAPGFESDDPYALLFTDELQERNIVRALIEFGLYKWSDEQSVAQHILEIVDDTIDGGLFDNQQLAAIVHMYKQWYTQGLEPGAKDFIYYEDTAIAALVVSLFEFPYEVSVNWKERFEMPTPDREALYREDVESSLVYFQLRKLKRMMEENQKDLQATDNDVEVVQFIEKHQQILHQMEVIIKTHALLKGQQMKLAEKPGIPYYPS